MNRLYKKYIVSNIVIFLFLFSACVIAQTGKDCATCHPGDNGIWMTSHHADTQNDVAEELAGEWSGLPADSVIHGQGAENCIACHGPLAITANEGMSEVDALNYFFSTSNGLFTDTTESMNMGEWSHVWCESCHQVPDDHPASMPNVAIFNSPTGQYEPVKNSNVLCGQCHGSLRYEDTDHLRYDAWLMSTHGHRGQGDVAEELRGEFAGSSPADVAAEENCVACHSPTSVLENGGMTEAEALDHFFTTSDGLFTDQTNPKNSEHWPDVSCTACHNPMHPDSLWYFNSSTKEYQTMSSSQQLCGQCHGNLRFPDTDHLSYNIESGTGGMGVTDEVTMTGIQCVDCHMFSGEEDTNSSMFGGHSWAVFVDEGEGGITASCTKCHQSMDANSAMNQVELWQNNFAEKDSIAAMKVSQADSILTGSSDSLKLKYLEEASHNLEFAESDESGGVHNHNYSMSLLNDAIAKSEFILTGIAQNPMPVVEQYGLFQNYPNPFNPVTTIKFAIPERADIKLMVYNVAGQLVRTLVDGELPMGEHKVKFSGASLSSGIYFYVIKAQDFTQRRKMILIK